MSAPREVKDAFGVVIEEGDYILSAATQGSLIKLGRAVFRPNSLGIKVERQAGVSWGNQRVQQVGSWVVVLRKHDGVVPFHIWKVTNG